MSLLLFSFCKRHKATLSGTNPHMYLKKNINPPYYPHCLLYGQAQWNNYMHGPYGALKVLRSLEFEWTKFKALKSLNFIKYSLEKS